ncbi:amidohydrolase family protein [Frigidibacter sp. MR17.14]|uniref:amidohydrolase family protein n=1 Tax=Frigidibacter sp. MR17.14 TaxID=3126509 RepID=UPI0030130B2E
MISHYRVADQPLAACDTHVHVFDSDLQPFAESRSYTPGPATTASLAQHLSRIGATRVVIVQPSVYGHDNRASLAAARQLNAAGDVEARVVGVLDPTRAGETDLRAMAEMGLRGLRANLKTQQTEAADDAISEIRALDRLLAGHDWPIQIFAPLGLLLQIAPLLRALDRPVILDHFAGMKIGPGDVERRLEELGELIGEAPNLWLKLSGACRATDYAPADSAAAEALDQLAPQLIALAPARMLWGSDWPHTGPSHLRKERAHGEVEPFMAVDDVADLARLARWAGPEAARRILVDGPGRLFFGD